MLVSLLTRKTNILFQVPAAFITMTLMVGLPLFVHIFPGIGSTPLGAFLLPIYFASLFAVFMFHPLVSVFAGLIAPFINFLLTGQPALPVAAGLSIELVIFAISMIFFNKKKISSIWVIPSAFGLAKVGSALITILNGNFTITGWLSSLFYGFPGLLILILMYTWLNRQVNHFEK